MTGRHTDTIFLQVPVKMSLAAMSSTIPRRSTVMVQARRTVSKPKKGGAKSSTPDSLVRGRCCDLHDVPTAAVDRC